MRTYLLAILSIIVLVAIVIGLGKTSPAVTNVEEFRTLLQSLAPTEAEAKAIAQLRQKVLTSQLETSEENVPLPVSEDSNAQISVEARYIAVPSILAGTIIAEPAMTWSILLPPARDYGQGHSGSPVAKAAPGRAWSGTYTENPLYVRFLEEANAAKFIQVAQLHIQNSLLLAPKLHLNCGQPGSIIDSTTIPFVEGVHVVGEGKGECGSGYQPLPRFVENGTNLNFQATVLQDDSVRLDECLLDITRIKSVEKAELVRGETVEGRREMVTVQVPVIHSFNVSLPEMVIPKGMSLLVAFPGMQKETDTEMFLLLTAKVVDYSNNPATADTEWSRFWSIQPPVDTPSIGDGFEGSPE